MKNLILFLTLPVLTFQLFADNCGSYLSDSDFTSVMKSCYLPGSCYSNVIDLALKVGESKERFNFLEEARILYITPIGSSVVFMRKSRKRNSQFDFHVVLEYRGTIYDPEYLDGKSPISAKEYFNRVFVDFDLIKEGELHRAESPHDVPAQMKIKVIPALDYIFEYGRKTKDKVHMVSDYYSGPESDDIYPEVIFDGLSFGTLPRPISNYKLLDSGEKVFPPLIGGKAINSKAVVKSLFMMRIDKRSILRIFPHLGITEHTDRLDGDRSDINYHADLMISTLRIWGMQEKEIREMVIEFMKNLQ